MLLKLRHLVLSIFSREHSNSAPIPLQSWIMADRIAVVVLFSAAIAFAIFWL